MKIAKDGIRSIVRIGYDGKVYKTFRGTGREERFKNEVAVLNELEVRGCDYVPRLIDSDEETLTLVTTNCGTPVEKMSDEKVDSIFEELKDKFGIVHDDPFLRNITYDAHRGRFCVIDFELAEILGVPIEASELPVLSWSGVSKSGKRKKKNEDSLSVFCSRHGWADEVSLLDKRSLQDGHLIFAISDGMGGHAGGEVASSLTVSQLHRYIPAMVGDEAPAAPGALLESAIHSTHNHVVRAAEAYPEVHDMGATLVCGWFLRRELHLGHIGDSRMYRYRSGELTQLTADHSYIGKLVQDGKMTELQARMHPRRNVLTQAIGAGCQFIHPEVTHTDVKSGDWYIICSDGVIDGLWDKHIREAIANADEKNDTPEQLAKHLLTKAYREAGRDDTTLFAIHVE